MKLNNADVRSYAKKRGVKLWELATFLCISDMTLTRKLRAELPDAEKTLMIAHIDALADEKAKGNIVKKEAITNNNFDIDRAIGKRINLLLVVHNKKQKELAKYIGVRPNVISYYVCGERTPNTEQLKKISKYFNTSSDYLLGLSDLISKDATGQIATVQMIHSKTGLSYEAINILMAGVSEKSLKIINSIIKLMGEK